MKKVFYLFLSTFLFLSIISCKLDMKGSTETVKFHDGEYDVYVFETIDDIRDSLKAIIKENIGTIYADISDMEDDFDQQMNAGFVFNEEFYKKYQTPMYYSYPDFSTVNGDYIVFWSKKAHKIAGDSLSTVYEYTYAIEIYYFDRSRQICSEPMTVDTGIKVTMKL